MTWPNLRPEAAAYFDAVDAVRPENDRGSATDLEALLEERELPSYEALYEIEAKVGGTSIPDPSGDTVFGAYRLLREQAPESRPGWAVQTWQDTPLVWIAATSALVLYAGRSGTVIAADFYSGHVVPVAADIDGWLAREWLPLLDEEEGRTSIDSVEGLEGERLARDLGLRVDAAFSDAFHRRWVGPDHAVTEAAYPYDGKTWTTVTTTTEASLAAALDRVR